MCRQDAESPAAAVAAPDQAAQAHASGGEDGESFPWGVGVFDAHCHPTDTMASLAAVPSMRTRGLVIMATRSQDQALVADAAASQGIQRHQDLLRPLAAEEGQPSAESSADRPPARRKIIPSLGWHPWFSHQIYDDNGPGGAEGEGLGARKARHYAAVLTPLPDPDLIASLPDPRPLSGFVADTRARLLAHPLALVGEIGLDKPFRVPKRGSGRSEKTAPATTTRAADADATAEEASEGAMGETTTPGGREGRRLSPHQVSLPHQVRVFEAQLRLAGELDRAASVHAVKAHGAVFDLLTRLWSGHEREVVSNRHRRLVAPGAESDFTSSSSSSEDEGEGHEGEHEPVGRLAHFPGLSASHGDGAKKKQPPPTMKTKRREQKATSASHVPKPFPPRICLHSFSGAPEMVRQYLHPSVPSDVFFSFSAAINLPSAGESEGGGSGHKKFVDVVAACADDRLLVETDLHRAGLEADAALELICRRVCAVKGWGLREGVERLRRNWERFVFGE